MKSLQKLGALRAQSQKVNDAYGADVVRTSVVTNIPRIPTGSLAQDIILGCNSDGYGGWAVGHGNCVVGWQSSGKTTSCLKACGNLQHMCVRCYREAVDVKLVRSLMENGEPALQRVGWKKDGTPKMAPIYVFEGRCSCFKEGLWAPDPVTPTGSVKDKKEQMAEQAQYLADLLVNSFESATIVYCDAENTLDLKWAKKNGCTAYVYDEEYDVNAPVASFVHVVPTSAEQGIDVMKEYIQTGVVDLLVVDSIPMLVPQVEMESSIEDKQRAEHAKLINRAIRTFVSEQAKVIGRQFDARKVTIMYVQQWRSGMGSFAANVMPGGNGQKFAYSIIQDYYVNDKEEKRDTVAGTGKESEGIKTTYSVRQNFKNKKNKTSPPFRTGSARLALVDDEEIVAGTYLETDYVFKLAMSMGFVEKKGSKYKFKGVEYTAQSHIVAYLVNNPSSMKWLKRQICKAVYEASEGDL